MEMIMISEGLIGYQSIASDFIYIIIKFLKAIHS